MEPKTKKVLWVTCGTLGGLLVLSCLIITIFFAVYGKKIAKGFADFAMARFEEAILEDLPEGVDKEQVRQLIRAAGGDILSRMMNQQINQADLEKLMNEDLAKAGEDEKITPDEFDYLVDRFHEVFYRGLKDAGKIEQIKKTYRASKEDEKFSEEEINRLIGLINEVLAPAAIPSAT